MIVSEIKPAAPLARACHIRNLMAVLIGLAFDAAPTLLAADTREAEGLPAPNLDRSFRLLIAHVAANLGACAPINPRGLALALRLFESSHDAPTQAQGGSDEAKVLWRCFIDTAEALEAIDDSIADADAKRSRVLSTLHAFLMAAVKTVMATAHQAGAVWQDALTSWPPRPAIGEPDLTPAQITAEIAGIALFAVLDMNQPEPDPSRTIAVIAHSLNYIQVASERPLGLQLGALAMCAQSIIEAEESYQNIVWLYDDNPEQATR